MAADPNRLGRGQRDVLLGVQQASFGAAGQPLVEQEPAELLPERRVRLVVERFVPRLDQRGDGGGVGRQEAFQGCVRLDDAEGALAVKREDFRHELLALDLLILVLRDDLALGVGQLVEHLDRVAAGQGVAERHSAQQARRDQHGDVAAPHGHGRDEVDRLQLRRSFLPGASRQDPVLGRQRALLSGRERVLVAHETLFAVDRRQLVGCGGCVQGRWHVRCIALEHSLGATVG